MTSELNKYEQLANFLEAGDDLVDTSADDTPPDWLNLPPPVADEPGNYEDVSDETLLLCAEQPLNDTGNGKRLLILSEEKTLYVRDIGWHTWTGSHWSRQGGDEAITSLAQRCAAYIAAEADLLTLSPTEAAEVDAARDAVQALRTISRSDQSERQVRKLEASIAAGKAAKAALARRKLKRREFSVLSGNTARIAGMITQALPHRSVTPQELDQDPLALNVHNGTLRFRRSKKDEGCDRAKKACEVVLDMHDATDRMAKIAPVDYDPSADCPRFMAFLDRFQPNKAIQRFLQTYHGYALTGLTGEQCLVFNYGLGANGKSTFVDIIAQIMGDYAKTLA